MRRGRRQATVLGLVSVVGAAVLATSAGVAPVSAGVPTLMTPVGGGYEVPSINGFVDAVTTRAPGPVVKLVVVPSSYGNGDEAREENLELAQERTDQVADICSARVKAPYTGCTATLAVLLNRDDALDPANSTAFADADGAYVLGGDQTVAMRVLVRSPAEDAMAAAVRRGMVVGGTSAGNAVESRTMLAGYNDGAGPADGLRRGTVNIWWGDDGDRKRGLVFGSKAAVYDQHFFQRGRFGRLLASVAESDDHTAGTSLLGVGVDYATGVRNLGDRRLGPVFGASGVAIIDYETTGASHLWLGPEQTLSTRDVLVHVLGPGVGYDIGTRQVTRNGAVVPNPTPTAWSFPRPSSGATVVLGGDLTSGIPAGAMAPLLAAGSGGSGKLLVLALGDGDTKTARTYGDLARAAGWTGSIRTVATRTPAFDAITDKRFDAVVLAGADPAATQAAAMRPEVRSLVAGALTHGAVLADRHAAAVMGTTMTTTADPGSDYEDVAIRDFRTDGTTWGAGLGVLPVTIQPTLTYDYRWGRMVVGARQSQGAQLSVGIAEGTAVVLSSSGAPTVVGSGSVVVLDGRQAAFSTARNGVTQVLGAFVSTYANGEKLKSGR